MLKLYLRLSTILLKSSHIQIEAVVRKVSTNGTVSVPWKYVYIKASGVQGLEGAGDCRNFAFPKTFTCISVSAPWNVYVGSRGRGQNGRNLRDAENVWHFAIGKGKKKMRPAMDWAVISSKGFGKQEVQTLLFLPTTKIFRQEEG